MKTIINSDPYNIVVDGASIRVTNKEVSSQSSQFKIGVVSILPKVQVLLGDKLDTFIQALELSRIPIALRKTTDNNGYETYDILRLPTGNIKEGKIATLAVYKGIMVGLTYSRQVLKNKEFRRLVKLSVMHQVCICGKGDPQRLLKAVTCISKITRVPTDKLIVLEKARSIRVRVKFNSRLDLPLYYIFSLDESNRYNLSQISFDINDAAMRIK